MRIQEPLTFGTYSSFWNCHLLECGREGRCQHIRDVEPCRVWIRAICIRCQNSDCLFRQESSYLNKREGTNVLLAGAKPKEVSSFSSVKSSLTIGFSHSPRTECESFPGTAMIWHFFYTQTAWKEANWEILPDRNHVAVHRGWGALGQVNQHSRSGQLTRGAKPLLLTSIAQFLHPFLTQEVTPMGSLVPWEEVGGILVLSCARIHQGRAGPAKKGGGQCRPAGCPRWHFCSTCPAQRKAERSKAFIHLSVNPRQILERMSCLISAHHPKTNTWSHQKGACLNSSHALPWEQGNCFVFLSLIFLLWLFLKYSAFWRLGLKR